MTLLASQKIFCQCDKRTLPIANDAGKSLYQNFFYLRLIFCQLLIRTVGWMKTMVKINLPLPEKQQCSQLLYKLCTMFLEGGICNPP